MTVAILPTGDRDNMTDTFRVSVRTAAGVTVMTVPFAMSGDWEEYWRKMTTEPASLSVFAGLGMIILSKEALSPGGTWEALTVIPMEVSQ